MKYTLIVCLLLQAINSNAQFTKQSYKDRNSGSFSKGASIISLGYGFGMQVAASDKDFYGYISYALGLKDKTIWKRGGPIYAKYEYGILDEVGIGVNLSRTRFRPQEEYKDYLGESTNVNVWSISVMPIYHSNKLINSRNTDIYAGIGVGGSMLRYKDDSRKHTESNFNFVFRVGIRQYLGGNFGVYADMGTDRVSLFNTGVSFRIGEKKEKSDYSSVVNKILDIKDSDKDEDPIDEEE